MQARQYFLVVAQALVPELQLASFGVVAAVTLLKWFWAVPKAPPEYYLGCVLDLHSNISGLRYPMSILDISPNDIQWGRDTTSWTGRFGRLLVLLGVLAQAMASAVLGMRRLAIVSSQGHILDIRNCITALSAVIVYLFSISIVLLNHKWDPVPSLLPLPERLEARLGSRRHWRQALIYLVAFLAHQATLMAGIPAVEPVLGSLRYKAGLLAQARTALSSAQDIANSTMGSLIARRNKMIFDVAVNIGGWKPPANFSLAATTTYAAWEAQNISLSFDIHTYADLLDMTVQCIRNFKVAGVTLPLSFRLEVVSCGNFDALSCGKLEASCENSPAEISEFAKDIIPVSFWILLGPGRRKLDRSLFDFAEEYAGFFRGLEERYQTAAARFSETYSGWEVRNLFTQFNKFHAFPAVAVGI